MYSKNKKGGTLDREQHEQLEYAQSRIRQKKRLYSHFVFFLVGSVFAILFNKVLNYGEPYDWYIWFIAVWAFFLTVHCINVFVTHSFMGRDWEREQRERLVQKQRERIRQLKQETEGSLPVEKGYRKKEP